MKILLPLVVAIMALLLGQSHCSQPDDEILCKACKIHMNFVWNITRYGDEAFFDSMGSYFGRIFSIIGPEADKLTHDYVQKLLPLFYGCLNQRLNKDKICSDIGACPHDGDNGISEINESGISDPLYCIGCIYASDIIKAVYADTPIDVLKYVMDQHCSYMKGFTQECSKAMADNLDIMSKFAKEKFVPEKLCQSLKICPRRQTLSYDPKSAAELVNILPVNFTLSTDNQPESDDCIICHQIVSYAKYFKKELPKFTDDELMNGLYIICGRHIYLKSKLICDRIVSQHGRELLLILPHINDPSTDACAMVGFCMDSNALPFDLSHRSRVNDPCLACKNGINLVLEITHHADEAYYDSMGSLIGRVFRIVGPETDKLTHDYFKKLLPLLNGCLSQRVNKDKICSDIGACPHGGDNGISEINAKPSDDPLHCIGCIYTIDILKAMFADTPIDLLKFVMGQLCSYMKGFTPVCLELIAENLDAQSKFIREKFVPETMCQSLKICNKSQTVPLLKDNAVSYEPKSAAELVNTLPFYFPLPTDNQNKSEECQTCSALKIFANLLIEQHPELTDDQRMIYLDDLCALYTENTRPLCKRIVSQYGRELLLILHHIHDPTIDPCEMVGLCIDLNASDLSKGNLTSTKPNV